MAMPQRLGEQAVDVQAGSEASAQTGATNSSHPHLGSVTCYHWLSGSHSEPELHRL